MAQDNTQDNITSNQWHNKATTLQAINGARHISKFDADS
jgi:hypothetical protein